jgi:hypothetical protein
MQKEALLRLNREGLAQWFQSHLWGAPWAHTEDRRQVLTHSWASPQRVRVSGVTTQPVGAIRKQRVMLIDHGFPLTHLSESGLTCLHHASHANNRPEAVTPAHSHGAQTLGLWLQSNTFRTGADPSPLLLWDLPDALLGSMPLGALWPDVLDAVHWGVHSAQPGEELVILLSVVSSDGLRHPQSFVTRSAQALQNHAQALGVDLKWVMAAGNQHDAQQHLRYRVLPGQVALWQWALPADNAQASLLECWHDAGAGTPEVEFKPPAGGWQRSGHGVTSASRLGPNGKIQTVFRLPPSRAEHEQQNQAVAGVWGVRWQAPGGTTDLEVHLSMMSSHRSGHFRQAKLFHDPEGTANATDIQSLSGLIPHMPGVWVAQTLGPWEVGTLMPEPKASQLSGYCGRVPSDHDWRGVRCVGAKVDSSSLWAGLNVMSLNGHRIHRASGTSMAVPLVASALMSGVLA